MKFVIDMNLSPTWCDELTTAGWDAVHWSVIGDATALDEEILSWALAEGAIVLTQDLDFGAILAATNADSPSVVLLRTQDLMPESIAVQLIDSIRQNEEYLLSGALLILDTGKFRVRILPLRKRPDEPDPPLSSG